VGNYALYSSNNYGNIAFGYGAGFATTTGVYNTFIGGPDGGTYGTGNNNTTGCYNVIVASNGAFKNNTTGSYNTALGVSTLVDSTGSSNTAIGSEALRKTTGSGNVCVGSSSGYEITTGYQNTCIGGLAAYNVLTTGYNNVVIGYSSNVSAAGDFGSIVIGPGATGKGTATGFIAPSATGGVYQGNNSSTWSTTSDQRLKKNIVNNTIGLEKIQAIQVRNFEYRLPEEVDAELKPTDAIKKSGVQLGVIAQELQQVLPDCVKQETTGVLSVNPDNLTWYLVNAVKELSTKLDLALARIAQLEGN
jgi:hypothetical protein